MEKDFDRWNNLKKAINTKDDTERVYFHEGDIWWARLGVNVGFEIDGKHKQFARPVIILKKYNQYSFLALPLSTATRTKPLAGCQLGSDRPDVTWPQRRLRADELALVPR